MVRQSEEQDAWNLDEAILANRVQKTGLQRNSHSEFHFAAGQMHLCPRPLNKENPNNPFTDCLPDCLDAAANEREGDRGVFRD